MQSCLICLDEIHNDNKLQCHCMVDTPTQNVCLKCFKNWLIVNKDKDPNCPNCLKIIPIHQIYEMMDLSFLNQDYYDHRSELLFLKEQYYFIKDMDIVCAEMKRRQLQKQLRSMYSKKRQCKRMKKPLDEINENIKNLKDEKSKYMMIKKDQDRNFKKRNIIMPCPKKNCRGLIMEDHHNCICCICELSLCFDCLQEKAENHICKVCDKDTAINIFNTTKPCPQCGIRIFKISGCDQMWCTQCHTTFSYQTGKKLDQKIIIHNPHYFDYIFNNNNTTENNCETDFLNYVIHHLNQNNNLNRYRFTIQTLLNKIYHYENIVLPKYEVDPLKNNSDIRYKYLLKDINKDDLKRLLFKREKKNLKKIAVYQVIQILIQSIKDITIRFIHQQHDNFQKEIENIIHYSWDQCEKINKNYGGNINEMNKFHNFF